MAGGEIQYPPVTLSEVADRGVQEYMRTFMDQKGGVQISESEHGTRAAFGESGIQLAAQYRKEDLVQSIHKVGSAVIFAHNESPYYDKTMLTTLVLQTHVSGKPDPNEIEVVNRGVKY